MYRIGLSSCITFPVLFISLSRRANLDSDTACFATLQHSVVLVHTKFVCYFLLMPHCGLDQFTKNPYSLEPTHARKNFERKRDIARNHMRKLSSGKKNLTSHRTIT
ncbi:hypothetical protein HOY82DRAFT_304277 [Tuber indicum]|nr:hypothetical protein HOY82DRAFT_304277 [Tuber indicum]